MKWIALALLLITHAHAQDNPLVGKPLHYLIDLDSAPGADGVITEVGFDATRTPQKGIGIRYGNLLDQTNTGSFGPYLKASDTAQEYGERVIDPKGKGWHNSLIRQFNRAIAQGFKYMELDNPDSYSLAANLDALDLAQKFGLKIVAKNPGLVDPGMDQYIRHPAIVGIIVERGAGTPDSMDRLRKANKLPMLPVWLVAFDRGGKSKGWAWANTVAPAARRLGMGLTYSGGSEYGSAVDIVKPAGH